MPRYGSWYDEKDEWPTRSQKLAKARVATKVPTDVEKRLEGLKQALVGLLKAWDCMPDSAKQEYVKKQLDKL